MFNISVKIKLYGGRFCSFSSAPKSFLPQLNQFASSAQNPSFENSNHDSSFEISLKNRNGIHLENSYDFSRKRAVKHSNNYPTGPDSVIAFLKKHHFNDSRISVIVRKWPLLFQYVPETSFLPKIKYFHNLGLSCLDIVKILTLAPSLLGRSLEDQIMPNVDFLKSFLSSNSVFRSSVMRCPLILEVNLQESLLPNVGLLREVGVSESHIAEFMKISPFALSADHESFRVIVEEVHKVGFDTLNKNFVVGIIVMREVNISLWKEKVILYKSWGWSENELMEAFRKNPRMMAASKDKITRIHDLLINKMGCDLSLIISSPRIFIFSFEKSIAPRCALCQVLISKGLIKQDFSFIHMLTCPNWLFLGKYIRPNAKKDPEILKLYHEHFPNSEV
ncbi:hypothetical protein ACS0TY_014333 [Phlomoides rotata]